MSSNAFSNHFVGGYRISECRTSTWYLSVFIQTLTVFLSEILLVLRRSLGRFLMHKYHVLSVKYFVNITLFVLPK